MQKRIAGIPKWALIHCPYSYQFLRNDVRLFGIGKAFAFEDLFSGQHWRGQGQRPKTAAGHERFAKRAGIDLVGTYHDEAVKVSDPIDTRLGFAEMLEALEASAGPYGSRGRFAPL